MSSLTASTVTSPDSTRASPGAARGGGTTVQPTPDRIGGQGELEGPRCDRSGGRQQDEVPSPNATRSLSSEALRALTHSAVSGGKEDVDADDGKGVAAAAEKLGGTRVSADDDTAWQLTADLREQRWSVLGQIIRLLQQHNTNEIALPARTRAMLTLMRRELKEKGEWMEGVRHSGICFQALAEGETQEGVAGCFSELIALKSEGLVELHQDKATGNVVVTGAWEPFDAGAAAGEGQNIMKRLAQKMEAWLYKTSTSAEECTLMT